jgi:hypothetical protein
MTKAQRMELNGLLHRLCRLRDGEKCLKCGKTENLQLSHIYPKGRYRKLEFDSDNVKLLCYACHFSFWHKNPVVAHDWLELAVDKKRLDRLKLRSQIAGQGMKDYKTLKLVLECEISSLERSNFLR